MTLEKQPWMKIYLLFKVIFQPAIVVFGGGGGVSWICLAKMLGKSTQKILPNVGQRWWFTMAQSVKKITNKNKTKYFSIWMFPKNRATPKWMVYNGKSYYNGWFGGTIIFGNTHILAWLSWHPGLKVKLLVEAPWKNPTKSELFGMC